MTDTQTQGEMGQELTLHLTNFLATLMVASQNAPLYLALTSVPTFRKGGSSGCDCMCVCERRLTYSIKMEERFIVY